MAQNGDEYEMAKQVQEFNEVVEQNWFVQSLFISFHKNKVAPEPSRFVDVFERGMNVPRRRD